MYGHPGEPVNRFVWILDDEPAPATELDKELWRRYVDLRRELETTLEGLAMIRNWLHAKLGEVKFEKDDVVTVRGFVVALWGCDLFRHSFLPPIKKPLAV